MNDREFTQQSDELEKLSDSDLEKIVIKGENLHIHTSRASIAKRILENRRQIKQVEVAQNVEKVTRQLDKSHTKIKIIIDKTSEIIDILTFIRKRFLPNKPLWLKIIVFLVSTVLVGIALNIFSDWIVKYRLHW